MAIATNRDDMAKTILRENLIAALATAIRAQRQYERSVLGYSLDSGMVGGWRKVLVALAAGEYVTIGPADEASGDPEAFVRGCLGESLSAEAPPTP